MQFIEIRKQEFSDDEAETDERQLAAVQDEMEALAGAADQEVEELEAAERDDGEGDSRAGSPAPDANKKPAEANAKKPPGISLMPASPSAMDVDRSAEVPLGTSPTPSPGPGTEATTPGTGMDVTLG